MKNQETFGVTDLYMLLLTLMWAINFSFVKIALFEFSPLAFNGIRMAFASLILVLVLFIVKEGLGVAKKDIWKLVILGIIGNTVYQLLFIHGINLTTASNTSIIMAMTPASVALLSSLFKHEKIPWAGWFGIAISFVGFYLVISKQPGSFVFSWENLKGDLMIFGGNLVWAVYTVFSKPLLSRISPLKWSSLTLAVGTVFYLPFCFFAFARQDFGQISIKAWSMLAFSGVFALSFGYVVWYSSVKRIGNTKTVIYGNIVPIFTVIFASIFIAERIGRWQALGAIIILVGVYLTRSGHRVFSPGGKVG
ncbi:MAG: DMT family transporter [Candidatus Aminicenantes bacterium]|nr:MAG: DMT family transporter [Candidatus Aminicenantes bacterium]